MSKAALKAIRAHCDECCGDMPAKDCNCKECNLWQFRLGKDSALKRKLTDEQRAASAARMAAYNNNRKK